MAWKRIMKKLLGILVLGFLFSGNANAGVNEIGSGHIAAINNVNGIYYEHLPKAKKQKKHLIYYVSTNESGNWAGWAFYAKKINEKSHKKAYKKCMKFADEYTQEDCFIYAIDDKIVWNLDGPAKPIESETAEAKAEQEKQAQIDKKPGRFFEDQPDVNDDYQIHFNYLLAFDGKDREWDINGKMEEILLEMNEEMLKATAEHKYSGGVGKKYKFDFRKDGKLDITFVRVDKRRKKFPKEPNDYFARFLYDKMKMQNPKKIYYNFADIDTPEHGGTAAVPMGSSFLKNKHNKSKKDKLIKITLHELHHAQGGGYACVPLMSDKGIHYASTQDNYQLGSGSALGPTYIHEVEGCPELVDSVYLTPTSDQPYDPYQLRCKKNFGIYNHPKVNIGSYCKWYFVPGNSK